MKAQSYTKETINQLGIQKKEFPEFGVGDTIAISQRIQEDGKQRIQIFQGNVIAMHKNGGSTTFTMRKIGAHNIAVERIFPYYSPLIEKITLVRKNKIRRAKLYYLRDRVGKHAQLKELVVSKRQRIKKEKKV